MASNPALVPRQRSNSLVEKLQRRQMIVEQRTGNEIDPVMEGNKFYNDDNKNSSHEEAASRSRSNSLIEILEFRKKRSECSMRELSPPRKQVFNPLLEFKGIPRADLLHYEDIFNSFDSDGDGLLTLQEIKEAMRKLGTVMTHYQFKEIVSELDDDNDDCLNLQEFITIYKKLREGKASENLTSMAKEIEVSKIGVGGAKSFFEDQAARTGETEYETELRLEREFTEKKRQEEEERRQRLASKASAFGDVKVVKTTGKPEMEKKLSKLKVKKMKSKDVMSQDSL